MTKKEAKAEIDRLMEEGNYTKAHEFWTVWGFGLPQPKPRRIYDKVRTA